MRGRKPNDQAHDVSAFEALFATDATEPTFYHSGKKMHARQSTVPLKDRQFIAWDGEGAVSPEGRLRPQDYVLLGCSTGDRIIAPSLKTHECLQFIVDTAKKNPGAFHVGFAFDYDSNMILRSLSPQKFRVLREKGSVLLGRFRVEHVIGKWLQITEYGPEFKNGNKNDKFTVRIADIFGFFQCSFVKACKSYIPDDPHMRNLAQIEEGKAARNDFTYAKIEYITSYWEVEIQLLQRLVERLREMLYRVGLRITRWHGPGALANYTYKRNGIAGHKSLTPEAVREAARYGYAGGRFELYRLGRHTDVFGIDINSAYPAAISNLPSLSEGRWVHVENPRTVSEFGIYHIRLNGFAGPIKKPSPLFHRDHTHNISYPWVVEGWYWSPEVISCLPMLDKKGFEIVEGWEYVGWETRPFGFVQDMYNDRKALKKAGDGSEKALKLALNSLYGKMAQRVGWERNGRPPTWHQLEWAGYVTSATRAKLYSVIARIPWNNLVAVETDGIYTTCDPSTLGITDSAYLGEWETSHYEEMMYVQSGVYFAKNEKGWTGKYRGLDSGSLDEIRMAEYLKRLVPQRTHEIDPWPVINGPTTRFIGYKAALHREDNSRGPMKVHHCVWETSPREISPGEVGKRAHSYKMCAACRAGANAYEMPHDLVIRSRAVGQPHSTMHSIPWEDKDNQQTAEWRQYAAEREDMLV